LRRWNRRKQKKTLAAIDRNIFRQRATVLRRHRTIRGSRITTRSTENHDVQTRGYEGRFGTTRSRKNYLVQDRGYERRISAGRSGERERSAVQRQGYRGNFKNTRSEGMYPLEKKHRLPEQS
jgi:hypothetical protein